MFLRTLPILLATAIAAHAGDSCQLSLPVCSEPPTQEEVSQLSTTFGHLIGSNMDNPVITFHLEEVIEGMRNQAEGKPAPMTIDRFEQVITHMEDLMVQKIAAENLCKSEEFLKKNAVRTEVVELLEGKVQYEVVTKGSGDVLTLAATPRIRYRATALDGTVISDTASLSEQVLTLPMAQAAPGLQKGMEGMRVGEKRLIFVHPEMTTEGFEAIAPKSLITFEIELIDFKEDSVAIETATAGLDILSEEVVR